MDKNIGYYSSNEKKSEAASRLTKKTFSNMIIVGHPRSGYEYVEKILLESGMSPAMPTLKEGLSAQEVNRQICEAHWGTVQDMWQYCLMSKVKQLEVPSIWHALVLDLVRGNLHQTNWGWADPAAVFLLDFWKSASPEITFVLTYDHPRSVLLAPDRAQEEFLETGISPANALAVWRTYNEALLNFFYRNKERCLLIHTASLNEPGSCLMKEMDKVSDGFVHSDDTNGECHSFTHHAVDENASVGKSERTKSIRISGFDGEKTKGGICSAKADTQPALQQYLTDAIVNRQPETMPLYEKLQAEATISLEHDQVPLDIDAAWREYVDVTSTNDKLRSKVDLVQRQFEILTEARGHELEGLNSKLEALEDQIQQKEIVLLKSNSEKTILQKNMDEENDLLLRQLHIVQENIEISSKNKEQELLALQNELQQRDKRIDILMRDRYPDGAAARQKNELTTQIGTMLVDLGKSFLKWKLLFVPIFLRRFIVHWVGEQQTSDELLPPLSDYRDYEEAVKAQQHLSYQLGITWQQSQQHKRNFVTTLWALFKTYRDWQRKRSKADYQRPKKVQT